MATFCDKIHQRLDNRYASIADLEKAAQRRMPKFAFDYLHGGIGVEAALARNRAVLDAVCLRPSHIPKGLKGNLEPQLETKLFGQTWGAPFGISPLGLSGLIWPDLANLLARTSKIANIPFILSTVATTSLEEIAKTSPATAWFQLYVPNDDEITRSLIERAKTAGYKTLVVTIDVPALGRRQRDIRNGLSVPIKISLKTIIQAALKPTWSLQTLKNGLPQFENLKQYIPPNTNIRAAVGYIPALSRGHVTAERLAEIRTIWPGTLLVKGVLNSTDALIAQKAGCDGIIISNHGGRQLDAAPTPLRQLPEIRQSVGKEMPILIDSGVRSGLDIARLLASGADFVFLGRGFAYGAAALGQRGADHACYILMQEFKNVLSQLGCSSPKDLPKNLM